MGTVVSLEIDVLKPYDPPLVDFTERIEEAEAVESAAVTVIERDDEVQNVEVSLRGQHIDLAAITKIVEEQGASVHSVDRVVCAQANDKIDHPPGDGGATDHE
jgi:hypothetical protein